MRRVVVESPLAGDFHRNIRYAQLCVLDCLQRGEAPFASHLIYPQVLDDRQAGERAVGIEAGLAWNWAADAVVFYEDLGVSPGMERALQLVPLGKDVEHRKLPSHLKARFNGWVDRTGLALVWETLR